LRAQCSKNDLNVILGDFNAVTGSSRIQGDTALGPWGSGTPNVNTDLLLSFCRGEPSQHWRILVPEKGY